MRKPLVLAALALLTITAVPAQANVPSYQDRVDAKKFARYWWATSHDWRYGDGRPDCPGVRIVWRSFRYDPSFRTDLAYVRRSNDCTIVFNRRAIWQRVPEYGGGYHTLGSMWWRFCATMAHEYGHLRGMPYSLRNPPIHSNNVDNVMAASERWNTNAWWWPRFPGCEYKGAP